MCRIMVLTGIQNSVLAMEFMKAVAPVMSVGNTDGIGYSAINSQNKLFAEKWHNNKQFLDTETVVDQATLDAVARYKPRLGSIELNYKSFGEVTRDDLRTVTMHTRMATCGKTFENTHPFIDNDISLIHNGVITNAYTLNLNKVSTCDSENALQLYINNQINLTSDSSQVQAMIDQLKGYWAFAFLAKNNEGNYTLDIVREGATLYWTQVPELGENCLVFATTHEIIEKGMKKIGTAKPTIHLMPESMYYRYDALTGDYLEEIELNESALNKVFYYPSNKGAYSYNYGWGDYEDREEKYSYEGYRSTSQKKDDEDKYKNSVEETMTEVGDDDPIESFYDTNVPLIDRLYEYDKLFQTVYGINFEDLPVATRTFIERKEDEDFIIFDDVLEMIETYFETESVGAIYSVYKKNKRD